MTDAGSYPFKQAAHYREGRTKAPRLIVIHDMEAPENSTTAEAVATYFARPDSRVASAHLCIDSDSVVRCVHDADTAYGAAGANADGLHAEHAGYGRQTSAEWLDAFGKAMLERSAKAVAAWCKAYRIPAVKLSGADIKAGKRGICGHADVSAAYPSTGHTDPGPGFPWAYYLGRVQHYLAPPAPAPTPSWWKRVLRRGSYGSDVKALQHRLGGLTVDGAFGPRTEAAVKAAQTRHHLSATGVVDRATAIAIG